MRSESKQEDQVSDHSLYNLPTNGLGIDLFKDSAKLKWPIIEKRKHLLVFRRASRLGLEDEALWIASTIKQHEKINNKNQEWLFYEIPVDSANKCPAKALVGIKYLLLIISN